ncbi:serine hydrolase domain-containing protein [Maribellus maritimus]|uniref:serine hydrolase domain-containing protein n=1 Tax=Maribellus maritimus TaxID=2870838 RepID=UPI001EECE3EF|nr:serine hydrolase domain-containing protein [Maribellus maritimus]MCG6186270.1 beta-lactamase family protein [Maribellus maritimus]
MELKKLKFVVFLLAILIGLTNCKRDNNDIVYNKKYIDAIKKVRKDFSFYLTSNSIPGGSIAISKGGEIIYSEAMGLASKDLDVPATRNTKFRTGSLTELFTSLTYQLLVEKGTLHPDSSVQYYMPEFPEKKYKITLENLVNNTSGIHPERAGEEYKTKFNLNLQKGIDSFKDDSLMAEPGYYQYASSLNYNLLGAVMEKATGKNFEKIVQELVIDTLHLENTVFDQPLGTIKGRSDFYDHNIVALLINATSVDLRSQAPSKGLLSNAEDLVKLGNAFLFSDYISEDTKNRIFTLSELKSGFLAQNSNGWMILEDNYGRKIYARTGSVIGGGATILIFPEEELIVACTVNATMSMQEPPDYKIATYFLPEPEKPEQSAGEASNSAASDK